MEEEEVEELYSALAYELGREWVRELAGADRPLTDQESEQVLGDLFDRWFPPEQTSR